MSEEELHGEALRSAIILNQTLIIQKLRKERDEAIATHA